MVKKGKKSTASPLDVRSPKDIAGFESLMKKGPMAVVLVYADWCGHCKTFKDTVWTNDTLKKTNNLNTASVHYDMVDKTSLKNTTINGYPSVFMVGKDKIPKEIPTPQNSEDLINLDKKSGTVLNNESFDPSKNTSNRNMKINTNNTMNNKNTYNNNYNNTNNNNNNNNNNYNNNNNNNNYNDNNDENTPSPSTNTYSPAPPNTLNDIASADSSQKQAGGNLLSFLTSYMEKPEQKGGSSKSRKTRHKSRVNRKRRSQTRRK